MRRLVSHKINSGQDLLHRHRRYEWDMNYRLKKMSNELTKESVIYSYDRFSNLVSAKGTGILSVFRTFDEVGNVYGTEDRSDRIYGAGSRLETSGIDLKEKRNTFQGGFGKLVTKGAEYFYDEEGNLARKLEADGSVWEKMYSDIWYDIPDGKYLLTIKGYARKEIVDRKAVNCGFQFEFVKVKTEEKKTDNIVCEND